MRINGLSTCDNNHFQLLVQMAESEGAAPQRRRRGGAKAAAPADESAAAPVAAVCLKSQVDLIF